MARLINPPSPQEILSSNRVTVPNMSNVYREHLYDYQTKTIAATPSQRFFSDPIGVNGRTISDTNMKLSGQLPAGQMFVIQSIQVELLPDALVVGAAASSFAQDVYNFYKTGALRLTIGNNDVITQGNLMKFCPRNKLRAAFGVTNTALSDRQYAAADGAPYETNDMVLQSGMSFSVTLENMSAITAAARLGVTLIGWTYRNAQ
jgi:hypothetical protein